VSENLNIIIITLVLNLNECIGDTRFGSGHKFTTEQTIFFIHEFLNVAFCHFLICNLFLLDLELHKVTEHIELSLFLY